MVLATVATFCATAGCGRTRPDDQERAHEAAYLGDAQNRRAALLASLVNPDNAYATLRRGHYATGVAGDWDRLRAWNPRAAVVTANELEETDPQPRGTDFVTLPVSEESRLPSAAELHALGERAFFRYPAQLTPALPAPLDAARAARYGLWIDGAHGVGGLVRAEMADGSTRLAFSCATCHADIVDGRLVAGVPSARLDVGRMIADADAAGGTDSETVRNVLAWGAGRIDVTTADGTLPERIADLRPVCWLGHLHYDATVRQNDLVSLAIRIETLIVTAHAQALRPPRVVALALARFIWDLGGDLPETTTGGAPGAWTFEQRCSGCHAGTGLTGSPQPLEAVGTDPALGVSADRGTGSYRVPSLRGVGTRPTLFHDGSLPSLTALLDPTRLGASYRGGVRGAGAVPGHAFGLDLSPEERRALVSYLQRQ